MRLFPMNKIVNAIQEYLPLAGVVAVCLGVIWWLAPGELPYREIAMGAAAIAALTVVYLLGLLGGWLSEGSVPRFIQIVGSAIMFASFGTVSVVLLTFFGYMFVTMLIDGVPTACTHCD